MVLKQGKMCLLLLQQWIFVTLLEIETYHYETF